MNQIKSNGDRWKQLILGSLFLLLAAGLFFGPVPDSRIGQGDFTGYWSASYLLGRGEDFGNVDLLDRVERTLTGWKNDFTIITWNPPWLLSLLLPLTLLSFERASWLWLILNIGLIFSGSILVWLTYSNQERIRRRFWLIIPFAFLFFPALNAVYLGQVNVLVFFGLSLFIYFQDRNHPVRSGAALALTTIKPHLVYVTLFILLLRALYRRDWRLIAGFALPLMALTGIVFIFRPTFLAEYFQTTNQGNLLDWETPTAGGILAVTFGWQWAKLMGLVILPLMILWWWRGREVLKTAQLVQITVIISIITAPFGWTYDQIILLIPLMQIVVWAADGRYPFIEKIALILSILTIYWLIFNTRFHIQNEVQMFWVPLVIGLLYAWAYWRRLNKEQELIRN